MQERLSISISHNLRDFVSILSVALLCISENKIDKYSLLHVFKIKESAETKIKEAVVTYLK